LLFLVAVAAAAVVAAEVDHLAHPLEEAVEVAVAVLVILIQEF
jgi:hypothetical protein